MILRTDRLPNADALAGRFQGVRLTRRGFLAASALTVLSLAGCGGAQGQQGASTAASGSKTVRIGGITDQPKLDMVGAIAQKERFFEDELGKIGYTPEYQGFIQQGPAINEAFSSGALDYALYGTLPALVAVSNGIDTKIIANACKRVPHAIAVKNDSPINSVADLKGKRVVAQTGTVLVQFLALALKTANLTLNDVEIINSATDGPSLVTADQADAYTTSTVYGYANEPKGIGKVIFSADKLDVSASFVFAGRKAVIDQNPNVAYALIRALKRAYELAASDPDKAYQDLATTDLPADLQKKGYPDTSFTDFDPKIDAHSEESIRQTIQFIRDNQLAKNDVSYEQAVDTTLYDKAVQG